MQGKEEVQQEMDIMSMLKKDKLTMIKKDFGKREKGLQMEEFIKVMLEHLDFDRREEKKREQLSLGLIDLFKEIDVNGDGTMEWEEFSSHIIELGLLRKDRAFHNIIKNYYPSENIIDRQKHDNQIESVFYFDKFVITLEQDNNKYKVYNSANCDFICEVNAHKGAIITAEHIAEEKMLATSSNDLTINFWDTSTFNIKQIVSTPEIQLCMKYANWNPQQRVLYTGGSDAIIHYYDTKTFKELGTLSGWNPFFKKDSQQYGHASPIGDLLPIISTSQQTLVSAGLDGRICLWDIPSHTFKKQLTGHQKGIYSLAWSEDSPLNQCLLSAGLDHEAYVWNTYVKEKIFMLRGHNHPLVGVKTLPSTPQVVTADISGIVKVWDVRNFMCMQTFQAPVDELNSFTLTSPKKRIITANRNLQFFEYDEPKDQDLTDEKYCIKVLYNSLMHNFITLHQDSIKIWDARNGHLLHSHRELSPHELTQIALDNRQRKLFVGDSEGKLFTVNIKNGAKMKKFEKHNKIIQDLVYWTSTSYDNKEKDSQRRLISISRDKVMNVHDEDQIDPVKSVRYQMQKHSEGLNELSLKKHTEIVASCGDDGQIVLTNLGSYRSDILFNHSCEIKHILFLDHYDCLVAADSIGVIMLFAVGFTRLKNKLLLQKQYTTLSATNSLENFPIKCMAFHSKRGLLLFGDDFGNVTIWDISRFLVKLDQFHLTDKKAINYKHNRITIEDWPAGEQHCIYKQMVVVEQEEVFNGEGDKREDKGGDKRDDKGDKKEDKAGEIFMTEGPRDKDKIQTVPSSEHLNTLFLQDDIQYLHQVKSSHLDSVTSIEVVESLDIFATSSFDCSCHIWSFQDFSRKGSLILGHDRHWALNIDLSHKKIIEQQECQELLQKIDKIQYEDMFKSHSNSEEELDVDNMMKHKNQPIDNESKKEDVVRKARQLIDKHKNNLEQMEDYKKRVDENHMYQDEHYARLQSMNHMMDIHFGFDEEKEIDNQDLEEEENDNMLLNDLADYKKENINNCANIGPKMNRKKKTNKFNIR